jgi:glycosyltransferase involved in cell wall biosynthesis
MRILQIGPIPPEVGGLTRGGVATHLWGLSIHLTQRGHHVAVLADNYHSPGQKHQIQDGIVVYGKPKEWSIGMGIRFFSPRLLSKTIHLKKHFGPLRRHWEIGWRLHFYHKVIKDFSPEVIHVHHIETRFPFVYFSAEGRIPLVTTVHSTSSIEFSQPPLRDLQFQVVKRNLTLASNLIFVSQEVKGRFETLFPGTSKRLKSWVLHNPADASRFHPFPRMEAFNRIRLEAGSPFVLFVGKLIPRKGPDRLIESISRLNAKGIKVRAAIVGDGPQKASLEQFIRDKDLSSLVLLKGAQSQEELVYYYNAADLFVLPSLMESFGIVFLEAMLCGCPVIGTPKVLNELLPSDDFGYCVASYDTQTLSNAIEKALCRCWDREKIRNHALNFDWNRRIHDFEKVYQDIVCGSQKPQDSKEKLGE